MCLSPNIIHIWWQLTAEFKRKWFSIKKGWMLFDIRSRFFFLRTLFVYWNFITVIKLKMNSQGIKCIKKTAMTDSGESQQRT